MSGSEPITAPNTGVVVFHHFNLWAHMTALENVIEAPIHALGLSKAEAVERANAYLQRVGVYHRKDAFPAHLSGGEQQRGVPAQGPDRRAGRAKRGAATASQ